MVRANLTGIKKYKIQKGGGSKLYWLIFLLPFIFYLFWEIYWYAKVGLLAVKWHTHVMAYVYVWLFVVVCIKVFRGTRFSENLINYFLTFTTVFITLLALEVFLELSGICKTYLEKVNCNYESLYTPSGYSYYHAWPPNKPHWITKQEYSYSRPTNSLGFGDMEWPVVKKNGERRILSLGDSFTEGDGAPYDSSYVALFKKKLLRLNAGFTVMNAGVCGSDPFFNYVALKDKLLRYKPDFIIQVISSTDMNADILMRGGMERFQQDGTLKYSNAPWWEPIYAINYVSRIFFALAGYKENLQKGEISIEDRQRVNAGVISLLKHYSELCRQNNIHLIVVLRPDSDEIKDNTYAYDFSDILKEIKSNKQLKFIDLLPAYQNYIAGTHTQIDDYFWNYDGHHNSKGYEMMAQTIFENFIPILNSEGESMLE